MSGLLLAASAVAAGKVSLYSGGEKPGHYLLWNGKPVLLVGDSVTQGWMEGGTNFNQTGYVDALSSRGINLILIWTFIGTDSATQSSDSRIGYNAPELWPWAGSTDANTMDLLTFNQAYFDRLKAFVSYAESNGIVVVVQLHDGWTKTRFGGHPYNSANGNGPLTSNLQFVELADYNNEMPTTYNAGWSRQQENQYFQERFAAKLISELDAYSNVIYEMFNEGEWYDTTQRRQHEQHFLAFFRARCTNLLVSNTDHITGDTPHSDTKVDIISLHSNPWTGKFGVFQTGFLTTPVKPYLESEPVPEFNGTSTVPMTTVRQCMWERALAGAGWVNQNDASFGWDPNAAIVAQAANRNLAYDYAGHCARFFNGTNADVQFGNMQPYSTLASSGICLAKPGAEYVVYSPSGASFTVNLSAGNNLYTVRWYNPRTGQTTTNANVSGGSASQSFTTPDSNDWVLHLKATVATSAAINILGNGVAIANGDTTPSAGDQTDFGSVDSGAGSVTRVFTIQNYGGSPLTVSNVTLTGSTDFMITSSPASTVAANGSTTFSIRFDPSANGLRTATVTVSNSDTNANPYTFAIQGTGISTANGLVAWWRFNEGSGTTLADSSGNGLTATVVSTPSWDPNGYLYYASGFSRVSAGNPTAVQLTGPMTVSAWTIAVTNSWTSGGRLISKCGSSSSRGWELNCESSRVYAFQVASNSTTLVSVQGGTPPYDVWVHVVGVYDPGAGKMNLYTNGVLAATRTSGVPGSQLESGQNLSIGYRPDGTLPWGYTLDDVRIYSRALSVDEIRALPEVVSGKVPLGILVKYKTRQSGNWGDYNTWAFNTGSPNGYVNATSGLTPTSGDDTILITNTVTVATGAIADQVTVDSGGQLTINSGQTLTIANGSGTDLAVDGTLGFVGTGKIDGAGSVSINSGSTLTISSANGITSSGASGNIQATGVRTYSTEANYIYSGTANQDVGNGLPATVNNLTIDNTGGGGNNMVTLADNLTVSGTITVAAGTLNANGNNVAADKLSGTGAIGNAGVAMTLTVGGSGGSSSFGGVVSGVLALSKTGTGTLTLDGGSPSTYTDITTVSAGTLALVGSALLPNTLSVGIAAGATFSLAGITAGSYTLTGLDPQQTLAGVSSSGTAAVDATGKTLALAPGALVTFRVDGNSGTVGKVSVIGDLALNANGVTVEVVNAALPAGTYRLIDCSGTLSNSGVFGAPTITGLGLASGNVASLKVVPGASGYVDLEVTTPAFLPPVLSDGQLILNWTGSGQLQSAPEVTGPWTPVVPVPAPPYSIEVMTNGNQFFRLTAEP